MKIRLKEIKLKEETIKNIENENIDLDSYVEYIKSRLENANFLLENKILSLDEDELYEAMSKVFDLELDNEDLLSVLSDKNDVHYLGVTSLKTTMVDEDGNNITLLGAYTKKLMRINGCIPLADLRKLVNSYDFLVLKTIKEKYENKLSKTDKYEDYEYEKISPSFDDHDGLYDYKVKLLRKEIKDKNTLKKVLNLLETYVRELVYQAKSIYKLDDEDESLEDVCKLYKNAYESNFSRKDVFVKETHKKRY